MSDNKNDHVALQEEEDEILKDVENIKQEELLSARSDEKKKNEEIELINKEET